MSIFFKSLEQPFNLLDEQAFNANQRGEITPAQQKQIKSTFGWGRMIFLLLAMGGIGVFFGLILIPVILDEDIYKNLIYIICVGGIFLSLLLLIGYALILQVIKTFKLRQDINSRAILQGQGQLVYNKKGYAFDMNGNRLHLSANLASGLLPGIPYQIYYLETSKRVLSATMAYQPNPAAVRNAVNNILASANRFSSDAVLANQNGEVTFAQRNKLIPNIMLGAGGLLGAFLFLLVFIMVAISGRDSKSSIVGLIIVILVVAVLAITSFIALMNSLIDLLSSKLAQAQGHGHKDRRIVGSGKNQRVEYSYIVNQERFIVNIQAYTALIDGLQYRVYYFPRTKKLISIEALEVTPNPR